MTSGARSVNVTTTKRTQQLPRIVSEDIFNEPRDRPEKYHGQNPKLIAMQDPQAEQVRLAAKIVSIDDTIEIIRANKPRFGSLVIRYLYHLKDEIVGAAIR